MTRALIHLIALIAATDPALQAVWVSELAKLIAVKPH